MSEEHPAAVFLRRALDRAERVARAIPAGPWVWAHHNEPDRYQALEGPAEIPLIRSSGDTGGRTWLDLHPAFDAFLPERESVLLMISAERETLAEHEPGLGLGHPDEAGNIIPSYVCSTCCTPPFIGHPQSPPYPCRTVLLRAKAWGWTEER